MKDKEKQIEEIANVMCSFCKEMTEEKDCERGKECFEWRIKEAGYYYEQGMRKISEDSVVLSRVEYERLSSSHDIVFCDNKDCTDNLLCRCCEISECPKNIPEYNEKLSANKHKLELFQKLCKERERADSWKDRYKLLEEELKQSSKETAEKFAKLVYSTLTNIKVWEAMRDWWLEGKECYPLKSLLNELAKQFGVDMKE